MKVNQFKKMFYIMTVTMILIPLLSFSAEKLPDSNRVLTLKEVLADPDKYDGKRITIDGYYLEGHETSILASAPFDGATLVQGPLVWVSWSINVPADMYFMLKKMPGVGRDNFTGRVKAEGIFRKTKGGGHLGEYKYGFWVSAISVYDKKRDKFIPVR